MALSGGPPGPGALITNWYAQPDYGTTNLLTAGVTFGYAGYYFDQETGLYKTAARYYDPRLGRFLSPDPIRQQGGLNVYAYAGNDPLNATDRTGKAEGLDDILVAGSGFVTGVPRQGVSDILHRRFSGPGAYLAAGVGTGVGADVTYNLAAGGAVTFAGSPRHATAPAPPASSHP